MATSACHFWKLPAELRNNVWEGVLGGNRIHITWKSSKGLGHRVCQATQSDDEASKMLLSRGLMYSGQHWRCGINGYSDYHSKTRPLHLDISVLRTCRQANSEANDILLSTNIFSMEDSSAFKAFFKSLQPRQRRLIRSLNVVAITPLYPYMNWKRHPDLVGYSRSITLTLLDDLNNLRALQISMVQPDMDEEKHAQERRLLPIDFLRGFLRFRELSLDTVKVITYDSAFTHRRPYPIVWTLRERQTFARHLKAKLLGKMPLSNLEEEAIAESI